MRRVPAFALVCLSLLFTGPIGHGQGEQPGIETVGLQPQRGYFSQLPFERIDMQSGNLILTFTDLVLPGNAGMDLRIVRAYNHQELKWTFGFAGVPLWIANPIVPGPPPPGEQPEPWEPAAVTADGGRHVLWGSRFAEYLYTSEFWRYHVATRTLELPNGWVATYETAPGLGAAMLEAVRDPYGNALEPDWEGDENTVMRPLRLLGVKQTSYGIGADWERLVTFTYPNGDYTRMPETMTFGTRTWTYREDLFCCIPQGSSRRFLASVDPPGDSAGWTYGYSFGANWTSGSVSVTTPSGGSAVYTFQPYIPSDLIEPHRPVIDSITTGGRDVPPVTWEFDFERPTHLLVNGTATESTSNRAVKFEHFTRAQVPSVWLLSAKTLSTGTDDVSRFERDYVDLSVHHAVSWPEPKEDRIIQDGKTYRTTYEYSPDNFGDYHNPGTIIESGQLARTTTRTFDTDGAPYIVGRPKSVEVDIAGEVFETKYDYEDLTGFLTKQTVNEVETDFWRDHSGNRQSAEDANGHETTMTYDRGVVEETRTPEYTIGRTINPDGTVASETRGELQTVFGYDDLGRVTSVSSPGTDPTSTTYAPNGSTVTVARGPTWSITFLDGFGRPTGTADSGGVQTKVTYDALGRKEFQSYPFDAQHGSPSVGDTFGYDAVGRVTSVTHPPQNGQPSIVRYAYDTGAAAGDVTITDEEGHQTRQRWQAFGDPTDARLGSIQDAKGTDWFYGYNALGSLTSVGRLNAAPRVWVYDRHNRLDYEIHPESGLTDYGYDAVGNVTSREDAAGRVIIYTYDRNNRLRTIQTPEGTDNVVITYDDFDNRRALNSGTVASTFVYTLNRLTSRQDTMGGRVFETRYDYDTRDNLTKITYPSLRETAYDYDNADRITRVWGKLPSSAERTFADQVRYHPSGAIKSYAYTNASNQPIAQEVVTFDERHRPVGWLSGPLSLTYEYYRVGNVKKITDPRPGMSSEYGYDPLDRLETVAGFGAVLYAYDEAGNRESKSAGAAVSDYHYDLNTQRLGSITGSVETAAFQYDPVGNMTSGPVADQTFTYTALNMMRTATLGTAPKSLYGYDGDNLRKYKSTAQGVFYYIHGPGSQLLAEYDASSGAPELMREYVYLGTKLLTSIGRDSVAAPPLGVRVTSPLSGDSFPNDEVLRVTADVTAAPPGDAVTAVEFYRDGLLIGLDTDAPYVYDWTPNLPAGTYSLMARVVTASALSATSAPVPVTFFLVGRVTGVVVTPASFAVGQVATVTVNGNMNPCGAVEIDFGDGQRYTKAHGDPLSVRPVVEPHTWTTGGPKTVTARGHANCKGTATTTATPQGPFVVLTSPANGSNYTAPATIALGADASDTTGQAITRVEFYAGATLIGTDTVTPYEMSWANVALGGYVLTARAVNALHVVAISAPIHVAVSSLGSVTAVPASVVVNQPSTIHVNGVNPCGALDFNFGDGSFQGLPIPHLPASLPHRWSTPGTKTVTVTGHGNCAGQLSTAVTVLPNPAPTVSLTSPTNGTVALSGSTITMMANATDSHGITAVEFYADNVLLHTDTVSPYSFAWTGLTYGAHTLKARAIDAFEMPATSPSVTLTGQDITAVSYWPILPIAGRNTGVAFWGATTCAALQVNYGDGIVETYSINGLPISKWHTYATHGTYTVTATGQGSCAGTASTTVTVAAPPTVTVTWPPNGTGYPVPASVATMASANDADGAVVGVAYYANGDPLSWVTTAPYWALWGGVGTGAFTLHAVAVDTQGIRTVSAPVAITVGSPVPSRLTGVSVLPSQPLHATEPATVTLTGTNPCGAVQVNFGDGNVQTLSVGSLPYTLAYTWWVPGTYTITATGSANCAGTVSRTFTVSGATAPAPAPAPAPADALLDTGEELDGRLSGPASSEGEPDDQASEATSFDENGTLSGPSVMSDVRRHRTLADAGPWAALSSTGAAALQSQVVLTVNLMGTGTGTVVSAPAGITCTGGFGLRCVGTFTAGTTVTFAAAPGTNATFAGWGGACNGTGACQVVLTQQAIVVATFRVPPPQVTQYYHLDALGTVRVVTNNSGAVIRRTDYAPFGEVAVESEPQPLPALAKQQRFTGKERDVETAFDYFGARYYATRTGRFTTVDPLMNIEAALTDPQRWNRYAYSLNNPLTFVDPDGRDPRYALWMRIVQSAPVQRLINHPATQRLIESSAVSRGTALFHRINDRLLDLSLKLSSSPIDDMIVGQYGQISRRELEGALSGAGSTVELVTKLTQSPAVGRALSAAGGEGAQALAAASRTNGALYVARIPQHAITLLQNAGLLQIRQTMMNGVLGVEYRFSAKAMEYLSRYFQEVAR